jgi:hypothetical protein
MLAAPSRRLEAAPGGVMRRLALVTLLLASASVLSAAGWNKPYFAATKPGSFATYKTTSTVGPASTYTMTRLADRNGQVVLDSYSEYSDKVTPPSTTRYELAKGFDPDRDLIDYMKHLVGMSMSLGKDGKFDPLPAEALVNITGMETYAATAVFKATEMVDGKSCDHYTYTRDNKTFPTIETGDIWLNASVPFGIVKHTTTEKDRASGKVAYTTETVLVTSGSKALPATTTTAAPVDPTLKPMTLKAAYDAGLIHVSVEIAPADKRGDRLGLRIESTEKPLTLTLAAGSNTSLFVDIPFENLVFTVASAQTLQITAEKSATITVNQVGSRRVVAGKFKIYMYEGKPMYSGSATMDTVK